MLENKKNTYHFILQIYNYLLLQEYNLLLVMKILYKTFLAKDISKKGWTPILNNKLVNHLISIFN